ncbi:F0F1 ATP synthase subunit A [Taibaiella koreensis]|uniref:F0F1 ATP synthase subunit A n=1 Tax=Taibaiella koreensis TaxID=1268548 RepID=UPI000E59A3C1|nr:F0F1 ATP synthase subunit A [Taibaiella koreensis]
MLTICKRLFAVLFFIVAGFSAFASEEHAGASHGEKKEFDASEVIFGHIGDNHDWHFFDWNGHPFSVPLPVIVYHPQKGLSVFSSARFHHGHESYEGYALDEKNKIVSEDGVAIKDFSITKNVASMLISVILLLLIMTSVAKKYKKNGAMKAPSGFQNALEPVIVFVRDEVAKPNLGHKYMRYMPLLLTVFFFIWINNLLGLLPGGANFTGNIAVTAALSLISFIVIIFSGNKHFWGHLFNPPGVPFGIKLLLVPIEIISLFIKPVALMIRLFANMLAGHIIILSVISMIFIFGAISSYAGWGFVPVSLAFAIFMFFLELLVAAIQAFIFTNLTAVFIGQAIEEAHHHDHEHEEYHAKHPVTGQGYNVSEQEIIA